jgi:hypothetical protein
MMCSLGRTDDAADDVDDVGDSAGVLLVAQLIIDANNTITNMSPTIFFHILIPPIK